MKYKISLIAVLMISLIFSAVTFARSSSGRCTVINKTGYDIEEIYISPVARDQWERCGSYLDKGDSMRIDLPRNSNSNYYDIHCEYSNGRDDTWYGVELYDSAVVTLKRNGDFFTRDRHHDNDHDDDYYEPRF